MVLLNSMLPQSAVLPTNTIQSKMIDENETPTSTVQSTSEPKPETDTSKLKNLRRIPLMALQPILATSPEFILTNQMTKKKSQLILYDQSGQQFTIHWPLKECILQTIWLEKTGEFLLLTEKSIWNLNPVTKEVKPLKEIRPRKHLNFQSFTIIFKSTLLIASDQWNPTNLDQWQINDETKCWDYIGKQEIQSTSNEFIDHLSTITQNKGSFVTLTIFNQFTKEWRVEFRHIETFKCIRSILLPGDEPILSYKILSTNDRQSDVRCLAYSPKESKILAIDSKWKITHYDYTHPIQELATFDDSYLILRTTKMLDVLYIFRE